MVILNCSCKHEQQDKMHGKGKRVHNPVAKENTARCTVCSNTRNIK